MQVTICGFCKIFKNDTVTVVVDDSLSVPLNPDEIEGPKIVSCPDCFPQAVNMVHRQRLATGLEHTGMEPLLEQIEEMARAAAEEDEEEAGEEDQEDQEEEYEEGDDEEEEEDGALPENLDEPGVRKDLEAVFSRASIEPARRVTAPPLTEYGKNVVRDWGVKKGVQKKMGMLKPSTIAAYIAENGAEDSHVFAL
ncbi:hypothetical protein [Nonomuraea gerenzanensis]|uniref:Uncharacterized protein n=1 Tax=Nonomuraea gerenzanensis TaxID=93944 RepID=A0A1M4DVJ3_9ACTN|nr:hypothetical protein [Nonomuraea gerenzanensis]UBU12929.1 hypothetical protein LCN96_53260 [Nonomuraea gerenzanensis]SBO90573.1 hypothetical protein BN4615_P87 [Nonomuraea gerenzanensis]